MQKLFISTRIVTIDAMGTQKEIAKVIIDKKADYILQVKGNQQSLQDDISLYFKEEVFQRDKKELEAEKKDYREICFEHGRVEVRKYYMASVQLTVLLINAREIRHLSG